MGRAMTSLDYARKAQKRCASEFLRSRLGDRCVDKTMFGL